MTYYINGYIFIIYNNPQRKEVIICQIEMEQAQRAKDLIQDEAWETVTIQKNIKCKLNQDEAWEEVELKLVVNQAGAIFNRDCLVSIK